MKNLNAIIILAMAAGMASLTACSSAKSEQAATDTNETAVPAELLEQLPLFIDMTLIENVVDEFECSAREGEVPDDEDIEDPARCLVNDIPYAGFGEVM